MPKPSRQGRLKAARRDPLRRAVRAPSVKVPPVPCPLGKCEHLSGMHGERALALEQRTRIYCTACDCKEDL